MIVAPEETVATLEMRAHYEDTGMLEGWTVSRVNRLCRMLHCTVGELAVRCGVTDFARMRRFMERGIFPSELCLHFAERERQIIEQLGLVGRTETL